MAPETKTPFSCSSVLPENMGSGSGNRSWGLLEFGPEQWEDGNNDLDVLKSTEAESQNMQEGDDGIWSGEVGAR